MKVDGGSWPVKLAEHVRNSDQSLVDEATKLLRLFEDEMLPCESFAEFCDVLGEFHALLYY